MYKIDNSTAITPMPAPGTAGPNPDGYFRYGTPVTQAWINALQQEVCNVILADSLTLSKTDRTQLYTAIIDLVDAGISDPGLPDIQADPDPNLGGDLDTNGHTIDNNGGSGLAGISANGSGYVKFNSDLFYIDQLIHRGDTDTLIDLSSMQASAGGSLIFDLTTSGIRIGGANARINAFLDDDTMAADSNTALASQQSAKAYFDAVVSAAIPNLSEILLSTFQTQTFASAGSQTNWRTSGSGDSGSNNKFTVRRAGTLSNLTAVGHWASGNISVPTSITVDLRVNGFSSGLIVNLGRSTVEGTDSINTFSVSVDDELTFVITTNAAWSISASNSFNLSVLLT